MEAQIAPLITAITVEFVHSAVRKYSRDCAFATANHHLKADDRLTNPEC